MKLAVFWEPPEPVHGIIAAHKERFRRDYPAAIYRSHPVHSTVFLMEVSGDGDTRSQEALAALRRAAAAAGTAHPAGITTQTDGWFVFEHDLATGGDTVVIAFEPTPSLLALQRAVADALAPLRVLASGGAGGAGAQPGAAPPPPLWTGPFAESMERYGFPFVGDHWLPHTTVASLPHRAPLVREITAAPVPELPLTVERIGLWRIEGESHIRLAVVPICAGDAPEGDTQ